MKTVVNILLGLLVFCFILAAMLVVSLLTGMLEGPDQTRLVSANALGAALPTLIFTFLLAFLLKTKKGKDAILRGCIWTAVSVVAFLIIGLVNQTLPFVYGALGTYVLLVAVFLGPVIASLVRRR